MATTTSSKRWSWNVQDVYKGLKVAVILPVLTIVQTSITAGSFSIDWREVGLAAAGGFVAYMIKNLLEPASIVITDPPPQQVEAVKEGKAEAQVVNK